MLSAGHKAIAIPSATLLSQKDKELLLSLSLALSFNMYPDRDAPGERLFLQLQEVLPNLVHHQLPPDCKDYSEYYVKSLECRVESSLQAKRQSRAESGETVESLEWRVL